MAKAFKKWGPFATYTEVLTEHGVAGVKAFYTAKWVEGKDEDNKVVYSFIQAPCSKADRKKLLMELTKTREKNEATAGNKGGHGSHDIGTNYTVDAEE